MKAVFDLPAAIPQAGSVTGVILDYPEVTIQ